MARTAPSTAAFLVVGMFLGVSSARASSQRPAAGEVDSLRISAGDQHIRTASTVIKAAINYGIQSSSAFRDLVEIIERSDSAVFLAEGDCGKARRACFVEVTTAGQQRFLWLLVSPQKATDESDLIGSIGHELRHTVEVINEPSVRSTGEKFGLYLRIGIHATGGGFETTAAIHAGTLIREEVRKFERQRKSKIARHRPPSSRRSHARAILQSRATVSAEMPSASAVSSTVSPPK